MSKLHPADAMAMVQRIRRKADIMSMDAKIRGHAATKMHADEIRSLADILIRSMEIDNVD